MTRRENGSVVLWSLAAIAGVFLVVLGLAYLGLFGSTIFHRSTADLRGENEKIEQVEANGALRVEAYNSFHDQHEAIEGKVTAIQNMCLELATADPTRAAELNAFLTAARNGLASDVAAYNADAAKDYTIGQFKDTDLPFEIDYDALEVSCS